MNISKSGSVLIIVSLDNRLSKITSEICGFFLNKSKYDLVVSK